MVRNGKTRPEHLAEEAQGYFEHQLILVLMFLGRASSMSEQICCIPPQIPVNGIPLKVQILLLLGQLDKAVITIHAVLFWRTKEKGAWIQDVPRCYLRTKFIMILMFGRCYGNFFFSLHSARWSEQMCKGRDWLQLWITPLLHTCQSGIWKTLPKKNTSEKCQW